MNNEHTPGFYAIEEYRCMHAHDALKSFMANHPRVSEYYVNIMFDCINAVQDSPVAASVQVDQAEIRAYRKTPNTLKNLILQKLLNRIK